MTDPPDLRAALRMGLGGGLRSLVRGRARQLAAAMTEDTLSYTLVLTAAASLR